jgi:hypothetical protein
VYDFSSSSWWFGTRQLGSFKRGEKRHRWPIYPDQVERGLVLSNNNNEIKRFDAIALERERESNRINFELGIYRPADAKRKVKKTMSHYIKGMALRLNVLYSSGSSQSCCRSFNLFYTKASLSSWSFPATVFFLQPATSKAAIVVSIFSRGYALYHKYIKPLYRCTYIRRYTLFFCPPSVAAGMVERDFASV